MYDLLHSLYLKLQTPKMKAMSEGLKEVARWIVLFILSWLITETIAQLELVPEFYTLKVWVFTYLIPVRLAFNLGLTLLGRFVDKWLHEFGKLSGKETLKGGLTRF